MKATFTYLDSVNYQRLNGEILRVTPAMFEAAHYAQ